MRDCSFASFLTAKIRPGPGVGGGKLPVAYAERSFKEA